MDQKSASSLQVVGYASFLQRFYAFLIDLIIFLPLNLFSQYNLFNTKSFAIVIVIAIAWWIYKPLMDWKFGGTVGKLVMKIQVVNTKGKGISFEQALLRFTPYFALSLSTLFFSYILFQSPDFGTITNIEELQGLDKPSTNNLILTLTYFIYIFSVSNIFMDAQKQALHDKIANCYCVLTQPLMKDLVDENLLDSKN